DTTGTILSDFSNEVSATITSAGAPTANFSANPTSGVAPLTVTFADTSTGTISTRSWDFGDHSPTSTATSGAKTYSTPGIYTMSLSVTGPNGSSTATKTISATAAAVADSTANPTAGTPPLDVTFTSGGTGGNTTGLVAAYNFEEASGATVVDASGKGNQGTLSGATRITQGKFGNALSFDGVNDWVTVNDTASLDLTTGMTLEAWVYPTEVTSGWRTVVHKEDNQYYLMAGSDRDTPAGAANSTTGRNKVYAPSPLSVNTWAHLAVTYDGANVRLYINGNEVASQPQTGAFTTSTGALRIGGTQAYGEFFQGRIDEIRVYNRTLSAAEISTDSNISVASSSPPVSLIGKNTVGPISDFLPASQAYAFGNIAATTGIMTSISVYVDAGSAATDLVVGLYSNQNGHPYQLLGQGTLTSPTTGQWNNVVLPAISVTSGTQYWIAILSANTGILWFRDAAAVTAQPSETSNQTTLTTLPSTWSTGTVYNEGPLSAYGVGYP
ncbi:MAG: LamG-like jellyroll fold domain-containing protein, partial [Gammaproteobacteria bacterium]